MSDIVIEVRDLTKRYGSSTAVIARLLEMKEAAYFLPLVAGLISQAIRSHVSAMCSSMTR